MFQLKKLLLPIDFSERCLGGARYAIPLVEHFHSELTLLHVISPIDYLSPEVQTFNEDRRKKASKQLDDFLCAALNHLNTRRILREGDPAEIIADQAVQDRSDLIMMPTHGYSPFRRLLLGSTTSKVLHDTECPVGRSTRRAWASCGVDQIRPHRVARSTSVRIVRVSCVGPPAWLRNSNRSLPSCTSCRDSTHRVRLLLGRMAITEEAGHTDEEVSCSELRSPGSCLSCAAYSSMLAMFRKARRRMICRCTVCSR